MQQPATSASTGIGQMRTAVAIQQAAACTATTADDQQQQTTISAVMPCSQVSTSGMYKLFYDIIHGPISLALINHIRVSQIFT